MLGIHNGSGGDRKPCRCAACPFCGLRDLVGPSATGGASSVDGRLYAVVGISPGEGVAQRRAAGIDDVKLRA